MASMMGFNMGVYFCPVWSDDERAAAKSTYPSSSVWHCQ